jgi:glutaredoxin-related protein
MGRECMNLRMVINMRDSFRRVDDRVGVNTNGRMGINIMDNGNSTRWRERVKY